MNITIYPNVIVKTKEREVVKKRDEITGWRGNMRAPLAMAQWHASLFHLLVSQCAAGDSL